MKNWDDDLDDPFILGAKQWPFFRGVFRIFSFQVSCIIDPRSPDFSPTGDFTKVQRAPCGSVECLGLETAFLVREQ